MANLYDFTFQLTGRKKQKACEEIIKNLKLKKCYVQYQEKELVIKFEESKYEHEPNIEEIIEEIQKSHKEDDFYLQIHKFDYVEPEDTEA